MTCPAAGREFTDRLAKLEKQEAAADKKGQDGQEPGKSKQADDEDGEEKRANMEEEAFEEDDEDGYGHDDDDYLQACPAHDPIVSCCNIQNDSSEVMSQPLVCFPICKSFCGWTLVRSVMWI